MPLVVRRILLVLGATAIAAGITYLPWVVLLQLPDSVSTFWGMTAILWAPLALLIGLVAGVVLAIKRWSPRSAR